MQPKSKDNNYLCVSFSAVKFEKNYLCISFSAVKFGRMSKKQREKVEDEVRYHKEMNQQQQQQTGLGSGGNPSGTSPDSSVFDPPQPSSTDGWVPSGAAPSGHAPPSFYDTPYTPAGGYPFPNLANAAAVAAAAQQAANAAANAVNNPSGGTGTGAGTGNSGPNNGDWPDYSVDSTTSPFENNGGMNNDNNSPDQPTSVSISSGKGIKFRSMVTMVTGCSINTNACTGPLKPLQPQGRLQQMMGQQTQHQQQQQQQQQQQSQTHPLAPGAIKQELPGGGNPGGPGLAPGQTHIGSPGEFVDSTTYPSRLTPPSGTTADYFALQEELQNGTFELAF